MAEVRCPNPACGTKGPKLLAENIEGEDFTLEIRCSRCKTLVTVTPDSANRETKASVGSATYGN